MAGFAIFMTIVTLGLCALMVASALSLFLYLLAKRWVRKKGHARHRVTVVSALAPFVASLWLVAALFIHVQISNGIAHQDCGLSADPYVTLPNGYELGSANTYSGYIKAPGFRTDVPVSGPGYVRSIVELQFFDPYFIGTQFDFKTSTVRRFIFDTRTRDFKTWGPPVEGRPNFANSYWNLYLQYRKRWPNYVLIALIIAGEIAVVVWVVQTWLKLVRSPVQSVNLSGGNPQTGKVFWVTFLVIQSIGAILTLTSLRAHLASFLWPVINIAPVPFTAVSLFPGIQISGFVLDRLLLNFTVDKHIVVVVTVLIAIILNASLWCAVELLSWNVYKRLRS